MIIVILLIVSYIVWHYYFKYNKTLKSIPGPPDLPFVGSLFYMGKNSAETFENLQKFWRQTGYDKFKFSIGPELSIIITSPEDVEVVLNSQNLLKSQAYQYIGAWLGNGLLTAVGNHWFVHRKIITPAFHFNILNNFVSTMNENAGKFVDVLKKHHANGNFFDIHEVISLVQLDVICETAMGVKVDALSNKNKDFVHSVKIMNSITEERVFSLIKLFEWSYKFTNTYRQQQQAVEAFHKFNDEVIQRRKLIYQSCSVGTKKSESDTDNDAVYGRKKQALMDILLSPTVRGEDNSLSDQEIRDEVATFIFTGHDTVSSALTSCVYCLAKYPDWQEKLYNEQIAIFGSDRFRDVKPSDINEMELLDLFIKETMRLYAPVPCIGRKTTQTLNMNGIEVPENTNLVIYLYAMGHNPRYFNRVETFNPERFSKAHRVEANPYEFVPFSAGPRNCIGQKYAGLNLRIFLSTLIRSFHFEPSNEPGYKLLPMSLIVYNSSTGVRVKVSERSG